MILPGELVLIFGLQTILSKTKKIRGKIEDFDRFGRKANISGLYHRTSGNGKDLF